ncbi:MAG: TonB-dependent receptor domain-containing protein, partial [Bacteroidia bacterium]
NLSEGTYNIEVSYISYVTQAIKGVKATADHSPADFVNVVLLQEGKQLTEVTVSETKITNTETSVVMEMKKSNAIVNTISAAQIQKSQDRDASEVVRRVPGVSIIENRFIMVRGLADRYNTVWLNDAGAPSSETDKKAFSFDGIPSQLIDRILVYKTASPELPGDFAGGMVKIYTTAMPQKTGFSVNYQGSYRDGTTFQPFYHTQTYGADWLANGARDRALPDGVPNRLAFSDLDAAGKASLTNSFKNDWAIYQNKANPDQRFSVGFNGLIKKDNFKFGSVTSLNYASTYQTLKIHRAVWEDTTQEADYTDIQSVSTVRMSGMQNFAASYKNHKLEFRNFYTQLGRMQTTQRSSNLQKANNEQSYAELYEQSRNYSGQLSGTHSFFNDKTEYTWTAGYARNQKQVPDYKRLTYTKGRFLPDSNYYAGGVKTQADITNGGMFFSTLNENIKSFNHNLKQKVRIARYEFELNAGNYFEYKQRTFAARELGYTVILTGPNASAIAHYTREQPLDAIFSPTNMNRPGGFQIGDATKGYDSYNAQNKQAATYLSGNFPIGKNVKLQGGVRYEYNQQALQSNNGTDTVTPSITTRYWLPSANLAYSFNYKKAKEEGTPFRNIIRASYNKTLNRPEFREWAPLYFYDFDFNRSIYGSLYPNPISGSAGSVLKVCEIQNYDFRYEFYPTANEYIQVGAFYKSFNNPIVQVIFASGDPSFTFQNAQNAWAKGVEIDVRKNLGFADGWLNTKVFKSFNIIANVSFIQSRMYNHNPSDFQVPVSSLQNQSPYLYNGGIYYQNDSTGTQITLLYNVFGDRLAFVGTTDGKGNVQDANIGEKGRKTLDLTISQRIFKNVSLTFGIQNILNTAYRLVQDTNNAGKYDTGNGDKLVMYYRMGSYYTFGVKVNF